MHTSTHTYLFLHSQYTKYKEYSIDHFQPSGDSILCKCKTEIDPTQGRPVVVSQPEEPETAVSGLR